MRNVEKCRQSAVSGRCTKSTNGKEDVNRDSVVSRLRGIGLFTKLSTAELAEISKQISIKRFNKNEVILHEENTNYYMYIVLEGEVRVVRLANSGKEIIVGIHQTGDFFGELSLIDGKTVPATVTASRDCLTAIISKSDFFSLLFRHRLVLENLLFILASRFRNVLQRVEILNFNNAAQRIKMLLLLLAQNYGEKQENGTLLKVRLIHQHIGDMTGLSRETVTRVLDKWKKQNEISIGQNGYILLRSEFESIQL